MPKTLYDKIWDNHNVKQFDDGTSLLYIDRHIIHEVTSAQAFEGLSREGRKIHRVNSILATADHNVPTSLLEKADAESSLQMKTLDENCKANNLRYFKMGDSKQGIVHIIGPEQGFTLPGITMVCGDSHTATHGAFGSLAFGIGTSEVEQVFATQTLRTKKSKNMQIKIDGSLANMVFAKDIILYIISKMGVDGGNGHIIEFCGEAVKNLSMEARMTLCNMTIEGGGRSGLIAPDDTTFNYVKGRELAPKGEEFNKAVEFWKTLKSDDDAIFDKTLSYNAKDIIPQVTWGTTPAMGFGVDGVIPNSEGDPTILRALEYMGLKEGDKIEGQKIDQVFIGSCTNARIEDLRIAASIIKGKKVASNVKRAMVVPGSGLVKQQAETEELDKIFIEAGFQWRNPGCSMCLGMNPDKVPEKERCASTSNRNFEGRQGKNARTHLMSPAMAAYAAIKGYIADVREA